MTTPPTLGSWLRIGVDINARTLNAAWVTQRFGSPPQWHYLERPRSYGAPATTLSQDLAALLHPLRAHRFTAGLMVSAPTSTVRSLTVQAADAKYIPEAVRAELPKLLPYEVDRAQVQFRVRRQQRVDDALECAVSLAACEAASLQDALDALWQAGWVVRGVAPAALALVQTAKALGAVRQDAVVLVDIGERLTTMVLIEAGEAVYARDVTLGGDHLTDALTGQVGPVALTWEEADALKREVGIPEAQAGLAVGPRRIPVGAYLSMVQPILEQLVSEIRRTMTFGAQAVSASAPVRVMISGEGSRLPQITSWLSGKLAVPVTRLNCEPLLGSAGATAAVSCGLALFSHPPKLDLQPPASKQRSVLTQAAAWCWRGIALATLAIWIGTGVWHVRRRHVADELRAINVRWATVQPIVEMKDNVDAYMQLTHRLTVERGVSAAWFRTLAGDFPKAVRLTTLAVSGPHEVRLEAEAQERAQSPEAYVSEFALWLDRADLCRNVQLGSTGRKEADNTLVTFSLTCQRS